MSWQAVAAAAFSIGFCTGLRCFTPICVLAMMRVRACGFFASALFWPWHSVVFPLAAVGELVADKVPKFPSRLAPPGLIGRIVFGGFCGAALESASGSAAVMPWMAALAGVAGAMVGAFAGNRFRMSVAQRWAWAAALAEDAACIAGSVAIARMFV